MINKKIDVQVVVVGSGPSGYSAAFRCADLGLKTILIEKYEKLGGVCLNVGCIPSKYLLHISKVVREVKKLSSMGVTCSDFKYDLNKIRTYQKNIINSFSLGLNGLAYKRDIQVIVGTAKFIQSNLIFVESLKYNYTISFQNIVLATGSSAKTLDYIPYNDSRIWNSSTALSIPNIPKRLLIIGSGIIGLEMATVYSALGAKVDVIDNSDTLLPNLDKDAVDVFYRSIRDEYNIFLNTPVTKILQEKEGLLVFLKNKNGIEKSVLYNTILVSVGRISNVHNLDVEKIGLELDYNNFIKVDKQFRTNVPNVYAIGDIIGPPMLAHKGIHEANIVAEVISGKNHYFSSYAIPCIAYTEPEIAWIGITEQEAIKNEINYESSIFPWNVLGKAVSSNCSEGITKLIFNKETNKVIGGCIVGSNAGELLGEIGLAIEMGCDAEDLVLTIHAHPTLYESINLSAKMFQGTITDLISNKLDKTTC